MCEGPNVTPATHFRSESTDTGVTMDYREGPETWASKGLTAIRIGRARTCLDCGHVMLFLSNERLSELRRGMAVGWQAVAGDRE